MIIFKLDTSTEFSLFVVYNNDTYLGNIWIYPNKDGVKYSVCDYNRNCKFSKFSTMEKAKNYFLR